MMSNVTMKCIHLLISRPYFRRTYATGLRLSLSVCDFMYCG